MMEKSQSKMCPSTQGTQLTTIRALAVLLLASCGQLSLGGSASADSKTPRKGSSGPSSSSSSAAAPSGSAHDKLSVLDVKIGMSIDGLSGYTCTKDKRTVSGDRVDRHCVKFVDERC